MHQRVQPPKHHQKYMRLFCRWKPTALLLTFSKYASTGSTRPCPCFPGVFLPHFSVWKLPQDQGAVQWRLGWWGLGWIGQRNKTDESRAPESFRFGTMSAVTQARSEGTWDAETAELVVEYTNLDRDLLKQKMKSTLLTLTHHMICV